MSRLIGTILAIFWCLATGEVLAQVDNGTDPGRPGASDVVEYFNTHMAVPAGARVPIPRDCMSACNMNLKLAMGPRPRRCVQRDGRFHVHAETTRDGQIVPFTTSFMVRHVPGCFINLTGASSWMQRWFTTFSATQVIIACPSLTICGNAPTFHKLHINQVLIK